VKKGDELTRFRVLTDLRKLKEKWVIPAEILSYELGEKEGKGGGAEILRGKTRKTKKT